jgi:hypothetical protein
MCFQSLRMSNPGDFFWGWQEDGGGGVLIPTLGLVLPAGFALCVLKRALLIKLPDKFGPVQLIGSTDKNILKMMKKEFYLLLVLILFLFILKFMPV